MDSGNSGSMQSSSGGDEEYDSRAETISAFLNNNHPSSHVGPMPNPPPPPPPQPPPPSHHHHNHNHHHHSSSMFDPLSNYFDNPLSSRPNPNSLLNLDMVWPKHLRSEPNCTDLGGFMAASSSSSSSQQLLSNQALQSSSSRNSFPPALHIPQGTETSVNTKGSLSVSGSGLNIDQTNTIINNSTMVRNPKKRSRASRRAPTTVLTTDTTNFRAMVQEFTGIPAPPFTSSSFPRTRLDLFGTSSTLRSSTAHLDPSPPSYLLRPFAQKFHPPPFVSPPSTSSSSSMIDAIASTSSTNLTTASTSNSNSTAINYQLSQHQNLLNMNNMHNPILNLQSLLQPQSKYNPLSNPSILGTKPQGSLDNIHSSDQESHLKIGVLDELGLSHGHLNTSLGGLQNLVSSDATLPIRSDSTNPSNWPPGDHGTAANESDQGVLRSFSGNYSNSQQRVSNGKVSSFSASSSDFHREKAQENVATTRTEGMVESWICSSD